MGDFANNAKNGVFITFEGGDGVGKTTHIELLAHTLKEHGHEVVCVREPGGTKIGEEVRETLLDPENKEMSERCELLLYVAARAQIVSEVISPALERGAVVLCDRFIDSTLAYQGYARGIDKAFIDSANAFASMGVFPHRTILLHCGGADVSLARVHERDLCDGARDVCAPCAPLDRTESEKCAPMDRMESESCAKLDHAECESCAKLDRMEGEGEDFHNLVNNAYLTLAKQHPERIRMVDSSQDKADTAAQIRANLKDLFPWMDVSE